MRHLILLAAIGMVTMGVTTARPQKFINALNQASSDEDDGVNNQPMNALTDMQLELVSQRLADLSNRLPIGIADKHMLGGIAEMKRASRFRQCYFNPVSCFRK